MLVEVPAAARTSTSKAWRPWKRHIFCICSWCVFRPSFWSASEAILETKEQHFGELLGYFLQTFWTLFGYLLVDFWTCSGHFGGSEKKVFPKSVGDVWAILWHHRRCLRRGRKGADSCIFQFLHILSYPCGLPI